MEKKEEDIIAGNRLIAEFMGVKPKNWNPSHERKDYDNNWNYLMPVVEKIEAVNEGYEFNIWADNVHVTKTNYEQVFPSIQVSNAKSKKSAVFTAVVKFITWYNTQSSKTDNK